MGDRELQIKITTDRSQARAAVAEEIRDLDRIRQMHREAARERGQLMKRLAADQMAAMRSLSADQIQATRQGVAEQINATKLIRAQLALQGQEVRAYHQEKLKADREASKQIISNLQAMRREDKATNEVMLYNLEKMRLSLRMLVKDREEASKPTKLPEEMNRAGTAIGGASSMLKSFVGQMAGLQAIQSLARGIAQQFENVRKAAIEASKEVTGNRGDVRELATLRGQAGDTTKTMQDVFNFRRQTGQTQEEAIAFQTAALGAGESSIGRQVSAAEFEKFMPQAAAFATMGGVNADTMGTLAGNLPSLVAKQGQQVDAATLMGRTRQLESIFKPGAGTYSQLTDQLLKTSSFTKSGVYKDVADQAALLSFFSLTNKEGAGNMVEQFTRATAGGLGRMRGSATMAGVGSEEQQKQAEYLASIGANEQMDPIEIGTKISEDIRRARKEKAARGEQFNAFTYLQSKGYMNIEDVQTLMAFESGQEQFQQGFLPLARAPIDRSPKNMADVKKFQQNDPFAAKRAADLAQEEATFTQGAGGGEFADQARRTAFARMKAQGKAYGTYEEWTAGGWIPGDAAMRRQDLDFEAMQSLNQQLPEGQRKQLPARTGWATGAWAAEGSRRAMLEELSKAVALEGKAPVVQQNATNQAMNEVANNTRQIRDQGEKAAARKTAPPPLRPPVKPQAAPLR